MIYMNNFFLTETQNHKESEKVLCNVSTHMAMVYCRNPGKYIFLCNIFSSLYGEPRKVLLII